MLSDFLKKRKLHNAEEERKAVALKMAQSQIRNCVKLLVMNMKSAELDGVMTRDEIETYVLRVLGMYETHIYPMSYTEFGDYVKGEKAERAIRRAHDEE